MTNLLFVTIIYGIIITTFGYKFDKTTQSVNQTWPNSSDRIPSQIDWVDQALIDLEKLREGPGELGTRVLLNESEKVVANESIRQHGFNVLVSDKISLLRSVLDLRITKCKLLKYDRELPMVSIIITFHNEHWSTLLRTVHSFIFRSPKRLIKELILVDDYSTKSFLKKKLEDYIHENFKNVIILRTKKREGIIKSRLIGAKAANGTVLFFVDSHCEAGMNWLPPLLQPIKQNYRTVTCPYIDVIDENDFSLYPKDEGARGIFNWNLDYKRLPRITVNEKNPEDPFENPIMEGGIFAISSRWFWELGGYDEGLVLWGGEQFELSFKIWMCGGRMINVPCSRIGHIYKKIHPLDIHEQTDHLFKNYKRIAEVWMDNWKQFVYQRNLEKFSEIHCDNVTKAKKRKDDLNCKKFDWFMKAVANDIMRLYPPEEYEDVSNCSLVSQGLNDICIDSKYSKKEGLVKLEKCSTTTYEADRNEQKFYFKLGGEIQPTHRNLCFSYVTNTTQLILDSCNSTSDNQKWNFNFETNHINSEGNLNCLEANGTTLELYVKSCAPTLLQRWSIICGNTTTTQELDKEIIGSF